MKKNIKSAIEGLITTEEASKKFGVHRMTLGHWRAKGLNYYKLGCSYLYAPDDIETFLKAQGKKKITIWR